MSRGLRNTIARSRAPRTCSGDRERFAPDRENLATLGRSSEPVRGGMFERQRDAESLADGRAAVGCEPDERFVFHR